MFAATKGGAVPVQKDPQFNQTALLLHGDGTNGANNTTIVDSSTNALTITRAGTPIQGSFSPFSQTGWSNYFNGSTDYLTAGSNTGFAFGTSAYTVEFWVYPTVASTTYGTNGPCFVFMDTSGGWGIWDQGSTGLRIDTRVTQAFTLSSSTHLVTNSWNHVVAVRSGTGTNQTSIFLNGTRIANGTDATNWTVTGPCSIGGLSVANFYTTGYMSNVRIIKGSAVYDPTQTTLTTPTTPLTAITNTQLLTCQSNRFVDNSTNAFTITSAGTPSVQPYSPLAPTIPYSASVVGGSVYFNGSTDYISAANNAGLGIGTGDYTFECWIYRGSTSRAMIIAIANAGLSISINTSNQIEVNRTLTAIDFTFTGATVTNNSWQHIAVVRIGTNLNAYINGVSAGATQTSSTNYGTGAAYIGIDANASTTPWAGFISNLRLVKGTGVYSGAFTPPTAPVTAITNTQLLVNGTNAGIYDQTARNNLNTLSSAQVSTTQKKYGTASMYFNGSTDYLTGVAGIIYAFGTGDFTVEAWVYPTSTPPSYGTLWTSRGTPASSVWFGFYAGTLQPAYFQGAAVITSSSAVTANTWSHIALCRSGTTVKIFINGTQTATGTDSVNLNGTACNIGYDVSQGGFYFVGYVDDLRVSRYARYTSAFTPTTKIFPDQ